LLARASAFSSHVGRPHNISRSAISGAAALFRVPFIAPMWRKRRNDASPPIEARAIDDIEA
jgi:hypothetical protein